ncbi:hypothetical protein ABTY61_06855 [Kitasatospora sp. NPDC096128]|uniref:hypothetical protein n=1 Tax=Kitasatospora sp. NPDC096128 TaxID=3155547 RepID=UPI00333396C9
MALEHPPPPCPVAVADGWEQLVDGLAVQRIHLHRRELEDALGKGAAECGLPAQAAPLALVSRPAPPPDTAVPVVVAAGLLPFVTVPQQIGRATDTGPLAASARAVAQMLTTDGLEEAVAQGVEAVCAASAWWVGAFAVLRHRGGHHIHIDDDVTDTVALTVLTDATRAVALGAATRVLRRRLQRAGDGDPRLRTAYCRAVTEAIVTEPGLPALLEGLGELRLVDLVVNALPWRGQFLKYRSGLGAGQVE